jgi:hypothetical protein
VSTRFVSARRGIWGFLYLVVALLMVATAWATPPAGATVSPQLLPGDRAVAVAATPSGHGYWIATAEGYVMARFGDSVPYGSMGGRHLNAPVVAMAATPDGGGYWLAGADGGVFSFGDAQFFGSMGGRHLNAPVVGIAPTVDGAGYWLAGADGGVFAFGDAAFSGSLPGIGAKPRGLVTGIAAWPDQQHYLLATTGGDVTVFGFTAGSWPGGFTHAIAPMVTIANWAASTNAVGYWTARSDGGVFSFGNAPFYGSMGGRHLNGPIVAMAITPTHHGYWLLGRDGGIFTFGDALFLGSAAS